MTTPTPKMTIEVREGYQSEDEPGVQVAQAVIGYDTRETSWQIINVSATNRIEEFTRWQLVLMPWRRRRQPATMFFRTVKTTTDKEAQ